MVSNRLNEAILNDEVLIRRFSEEEGSFPPWLFKHQDLVKMLENADKIEQKSLINILNRIHFMDGHILVELMDLKYDESILIRAYPRPCKGATFIGTLSKKNISNIDLENYRLTNLIIDDGQVMIIVPTDSQEITNTVFSVKIPEQSYVTGRRKARRYVCKDIDVEMIQNGFRVSGRLVDFSPHGFRIKIKPESKDSFHWFNPEESVIVQLQNSQRMFLSSNCQYIRQKGKSRKQEIVLAPAERNIRLFKKKRSRNPRLNLTPPPTLIFRHPLFKKNTQLDVDNISTSGFSVYENSTEQLLLPGMIISSLIIRFSGGLEIKCDAQVIYCKNEENITRCGLAILDMDVNEYGRLTQILADSKENATYITSEADMDAIWEFFFDTGFIYPKKYSQIQSKKEILKDTYQRIYQNNPEIAKQFIYQKNGKVYGSISMVRAYERAWMMHHYAARVIENRRKGFLVLQQVIRYLNDMYHLPSANLDYLICYFRPENRFPEKVFGGFGRFLGNLKGCSMDPFAYLSYPALSLGARLPKGWSLRQSSDNDLWKLNRFYSYSSGGLLMDALSLEKDESRSETLEQVYKRLGFLRKWNTYSLVYGREISAVLVVNQSNLGINFSELLRCIKIIVINPENLSWNVLSTAIAQLSGIFQSDRIPILIYPVDYARSKNVPYEKQYKLWIMNVQFANEWIDYMEKRFRVFNNK